MHFCDHRIFDEDLEAIEADFRFYYDCLMGPNSRSLLNAMKRMGELGKIKIIASGHGPLLYHHLETLTEYYQNWSQKQTKIENTVGLFYVSGYGYSDQLAHAISDGLQKTGVGVEIIDLHRDNLAEIQELTTRASGLIVGMPPSSSTVAQAAISCILARVKNHQFIGLFESFGSDDQPIDILGRKFIDLGVKEGFTAIRIREIPGESIYKNVY